MSKDHAINPQSAPVERCKLFWDYYGPSAEGTAKHFEHHLIEWISREKIAHHVTKTDVERHGEQHYSATCVITFSEGERVYQSLKAHRAIKV